MSNFICSVIEWIILYFNMEGKLLENRYEGQMKIYIETWRRIMHKYIITEALFNFSFCIDNWIIEFSFFFSAGKRYWLHNSTWATNSLNNFNINWIFLCYCNSGYSYSFVAWVYYVCMFVCSVCKWKKKN